MIKNISISYEDDMEPANRVVVAATNHVNAQLSSFADEINKQEAVVELFIDKSNEPHISLSNVTEALKHKVMEYLLANPNKFPV